MPHPLSETLFEKHIARALAASEMYNQRRPGDFCIEKLCDREMLLAFLRHQPAWAKLVEQKADEEDALTTTIDVLNAKLNRGGSLLEILKKGITVQGRALKFAAFRPEMHLAGEAHTLYAQNRFSVVRQMKYSTLGFDKNNELDLCILLNGLPIATLELKNEGTGQTVVDGMHQYQTNRHPQNRLLRTCLVHFAMDNNRVMMTTRLAGRDTRFLPFNRETRNPAVEGDYPVCYMWREVLQGPSLLNLIQHFVKRITPKRGEPFYIFPRYHQLRCVRNIVADVREKGVGHTYLVQHSAGSGKTKSMSWLAFQLANMQTEEDRPMFDSVIMITDRIVLDRNIADEIRSMEEVAGTVKDIRRGPNNLARALEEGGHRIIISTEQKFSFALPKLKQAAGSRFAVIIDEAHTAFGKQAAHDVRQILTDSNELRETVAEFGIESRDEEAAMQDQMLAELQAARRITSGQISYFAFTATPKAQTFALYGREGKSFDIYSMRQAIEEGFILDVLKNYTTFQTMFELTGRENLPEGGGEEYEKRTALRLMMQYVCQHPYVITHKAHMMTDYFMQHTKQKMRGQAKAIVVTSSRANAVLFHQAIARRLADKYGGEVEALVAFSGEVEIDGQRYTEEKVNGFGIKDNAIAVKFQDPNQKFLVVADKFQTGFDQPLLHTMFVDRSLGGVQCIQTLSRLNRCHPDKEDTMIIDFVNKHEDVQRAFAPYYQTTMMQGSYDPQVIYEYKNDIEQRKVFAQEDVDAVAAVLLEGDETKLPGLSSAMARLVREYVLPLPEEEQAMLRKEVNRYVRQYGLLAQIMNFLDPELERFYMFCKLYYKFLPYTKDTLPLDILQKIDLDKYRVELKEQGLIPLAPEDGVVEPAGGAGVRGGNKEFDHLEDLLKMMNEPYQGFLDEHDQIILELIRQMRDDPSVRRALDASNTHTDLLRMLERKFDDKVARQMGRYASLKTLLSSNRAFCQDFFDTVLYFLVKNSHAWNAPEYNEELLKEAMLGRLESTFAQLCGHGYRELEEVLDALFAILKTVSIAKYDWLNSILPDALNKIFRGENEPVDLKVLFQNLLPKYEAFLRKIYYLREKREFVASGEADGWAAIARQFREIDRLCAGSGADPRLATFETCYRAMCAWRDNTHGAPELADGEVAQALHMVVSMYVYAVMVSIAHPETAAPARAYSLPDEATLGDEEEGPVMMAAEGLIRDMPEEERMTLLRRCINAAQGYSGGLFSKQRHWTALYRVAVDKGFLIDGDYGYFVAKIGELGLEGMPRGLSADYLKRAVRGVYAGHFEDWTAQGLEGKQLAEYLDIRDTAEAFKQKIEKIHPEK